MASLAGATTKTAAAAKVAGATTLVARLPPARRPPSPAFPDARALANPLNSAARPSISRRALASSPAPPPAATTATATASSASGAGSGGASATLVLAADAPAPAGFPACLPPRDALPPLPPLDDDYERRVSFAPFANWLVPRGLLLGRYPFVEPSRCPSRARGEAQLAALMAPPAAAAAAAAVAGGAGGSRQGAAAGADGEGTDGGGNGSGGGAVEPPPPERDGSAAASANRGNPGAGVRTFFSLQAELPPQSAMAVGGAAGGFLPYKSAAELIHAGMAGPPPREAVDGLRNPSLDRFLPARRRAPSADYAAFSRRESALTFLHCPIVDLGVPEMGQLKAAVAELAQRLAVAEAARRADSAAGAAAASASSGDERGQVEQGAGRTPSPRGAQPELPDAGAVLVHCWGGRGRAGTVGACLLVAAYGLCADEALLRVQRAFDTRRDGGRLSPETDAQRALVRAFAAEVAAAAAA